MTTCRLATQRLQRFRGYETVARSLQVRVTAAPTAKYVAESPSLTNTMAEPHLESPRLALTRMGWPQRLTAWALLMAASVLTLGACSTSYIANTDVPDTEENRKLITFCERYRRAVERKDIIDILKMASPKYYEDGGNVDASDDIDYAGLKEFLTQRFHDARAVRYEIRYRRISRDNDRIFVDYTISGSWRIPSGPSDQWRRMVDDNRLELVEVEDDYRIVTGM